jgi:hypothetical protein
VYGQPFGGGGPDGVPSGVLIASVPADAQEIPAAMKSAKVGQSITVRGRVAASKDAFVTGRAMFTLVDERADLGCCPKDAKDLPETSCSTPAESKCTVQLVDARGRTLRVDLNGKSGLKPGAEVFVTGTVQAANGINALVITAEKLHIPRASLPAGFFLESVPENAKDLSSLRKSGEVQPGDIVAIRGRIGGSAQPFVDGRAIFTLVGRDLKACNEKPGDTCPMPWDYCCEEPGDIRANSATVQVVDEKGQPLRTDLKGRMGLKELTEVVIVGKVATADNKVMIVNATGIAAAR